MCPILSLVGVVVYVCAPHMSAFVSAKRTPAGEYLQNVLRSLFLLLLLFLLSVTVTSL